MIAGCLLAPAIFIALITNQEFLSLAPDSKINIF